MTQPERPRSIGGMTDQQLRELISSIVTHEQGCKGVELVTKVIVRAHSSGVGAFDSQTVTEALGRMVGQGDLVEVEYVLPEAPHRAKSFFLPKGARAALGPGS